MLSKILMRISKRERVMAISLLIVLMLLWLGQLTDSWEEVSGRLRQTRKDISLQKVWLDSADAFNQELQKVRGRINSKDTLNSAQLTDFLDELGRSRKLTYELSTPVTKDGQLFREHTLRVAYRNVTLEQMIALYEEIDRRKPYVSIDEINFSVNRSDQRLLNVRLTLSSFELKEPNTVTK